MSGTDARALAAALVTVVMWGSAFVGIRALADSFSPGSIVVGRILVGVVILGAFALPRARPSMTRGDLITIVVFGCLWFAVYSFALNAGERHVDAGTAVLIVNLGPILIAILAGTFLGEGIPAQLITGCVIALGGTLLVAASTASDGDSATSSTQGITLVLLATLAYAVAGTLQKRALRTVPGLWVNVLGLLAALVVSLPFVSALVAEAGAADPADLAWLLYLGIGPTAIGFMTWAYALARTSAGQTAAVAYLIPVVAIVLSWLLLGELPGGLAIAGGAICIVGVIVARSGTFRWLPARQQT